jgi:predicted nucleotidyltransferase
MEKELVELIERLKTTAGGNLKSVVLYGSAVTGEFTAGRSDLNVLCIVERTGASELEAMRPAVAWWMKQGQAAPLVFTIDELHRSADIFAIELLDIVGNHRTLLGDDHFLNFEVPTWLHRLQVERELRTNWVRLRRAVIATPGKKRDTLALMTNSISSFATLFRHALLGMNEAPPRTVREAIEGAAHLVGGDPAPFLTVLDVRDGKKKEAEIDVEAILHGYLELVQLITDEVDRRFQPRRS